MPGRACILCMIVLPRGIEHHVYLLFVLMYVHVCVFVLLYMGPTGYKNTNHLSVINSTCTLERLYHNKGYDAA